MPASMLLPYGRCLIEGVTIVAISRLVEPMFHEGYAQRTRQDILARNVKLIKFKGIEYSLFGGSNAKTKSTLTFSKHNSFCVYNKRFIVHG